EREGESGVMGGKGGGGGGGQAAASGQIGIGASSQKRRHGSGPFGFGGRIERGRAIEIASVDRRALGDKPLDQRHMSAACRKSKRHRARPVARLQRCARCGQATRQSTAVPGRRSKQQGVELNRGDACLCQIIVLLKLTAISLGGPGMANHKGTKKRRARSPD